MINIGNQVFTRIAENIRSSYPDIDLTSEYVKAPAKFPHVSIVVADNYMSVSQLDSSDRERYATIVLEINVYSNKASTKKTECETIASIIDETLYSLNFVRTAMTPVPNLEDATIYRIISRYRAMTDGTNIYRVV